jgi:hypothetical protein
MGSMRNEVMSTSAHVTARNPHVNVLYVIIYVLNNLLCKFTAERSTCLVWPC